MLHASCSNLPPIMFDITAPILRDVRRSGLPQWYPQSPLRVLNDTAFLRPTLELQSSFDILGDAFDCFEMLCIEAFDSDTAMDEAETFKVRRDKVCARLAKIEEQELERPPQTSKGKAERAIRIAAKIHFRATAFRIQHEDEVNTEDLKILYALMRKIEPALWKAAHYVYLWVLLTGGAASCRYPNMRSYFVSEIMRLGFTIGLFDWQAFRRKCHL